MAAGEVNAIVVLVHELLLVDVGGGAETHLARESSNGGRSAVDADDASPATAVPRWEESTLCGRTWHRMAAGADDSTSLWQDAAFAPTCRACLRVVDTWFPKSTAPAGVQLLAEVVADAVVALSSTYVTGVPGEHLEFTRDRSARRSAPVASAQARMPSMTSWSCGRTTPTKPSIPTS